MSLQVSVRFYGAIHDLLRARQAEHLLPDGATVADLFTALGSTHGAPLLHHLLTHQGRLQPYVRVAVDGEVLEGDALAAPIVSPTQAAGRGGAPLVEVFVLTGDTGG